MKKRRGKFVAIEGLDFSGKDVQQILLYRELLEQGYDVVSTREPGGTPLGEEIREILLYTKSKMCPKSELLLFMASRAQIVEEVILPALKSGKILVSSRYFLSSLAYQGYARGLPVAELENIALFTVNGLIPDLTLLLDVDVDTLLARRDPEELDRIESEEKAFFERVRQGFLKLAEKDPEHIKIVDGSLSIEEVHHQILALVREILK